VPKLVSMKMSKADREKTSEPSSVSTDRPVYPWGLALTLDNEALEKLGMPTCEVGDELMLMAKVKVTNMSANESENGKNRSLGLQITDMALEAGSESEASGALYGKE